MHLQRSMAFELENRLYIRRVGVAKYQLERIFVIFIFIPTEVYLV